MRASAVGAEGQGRVNNGHRLKHTPHGALFFYVPVYYLHVLLDSHTDDPASACSPSPSSARACLWPAYGTRACLRGGRLGYGADRVGC